MTATRATSNTAAWSAVLHAGEGLRGCALHPFLVRKTAGGTEHGAAPSANHEGWRRKGKTGNRELLPLSILQNVIESGGEDVQHNERERPVRLGGGRPR
jgi:hypothetical protein